MSRKAVRGTVLVLQPITWCWQREDAFKWMLIAATPISRLSPKLQVMLQ